MLWRKQKASCQKSNVVSSWKQNALNILLKPVDHCWVIQMEQESYFHILPLCR